MGHAFFCVLGLFLLNTHLSCGADKDKPKPVLSASSSWLSPGASVTLNCSVKNSSAEWRFFWFWALFRNSSNYKYKLLPGDSNGTAQDSFIVHGQKRTAGYACRAGRGELVNYTRYSKPVFVWSGDPHSASATIKVFPDRVQHFSNESVSLRCEGNASEWRVQRVTEAEHLGNCSSWGTMNGSTCVIRNVTNNPAVYWCESKLGQFSNAVNITFQKMNIILVSPVHPVTEGGAVTLSCKLRNPVLNSHVLFFQNDNIINNDTSWELNITAVSKSHEGFYKCECSGQESPQSWVSVKVSRPVKSPFTVPLIIGFACGILLIIISLVVYQRVKGRTQGKQTGFMSVDPVVNQNECQLEVLYSQIHDDSLLYSLVMPHNKDGTQNIEGKPSQAAVEETIYSEVRI